MVMVIWVFWVCRNLANAKTPFSIHFILLHKLFAALQFLLLLLKYAWSAETSLFDGFFVCSLVHFRFFFKYLNSTRLFSFKIFMFENSFYCLLVFFFLEHQITNGNVHTYHLILYNIHIEFRIANNYCDVYKLAENSKVKHLLCTFYTSP